MYTWGEEDRASVDEGVEESRLRLPLNSKARLHHHALLRLQLCVAEAGE